MLKRRRFQSFSGGKIWCFDNKGKAYMLKPTIIIKILYAKWKLIDEVMSSHVECFWMSVWVQWVTDDRRCSPCTRPPGWWFLCGHGSTDSSLWSTSGPTGRSSRLLYHNCANIYKRRRCLGNKQSLRSRWRLPSVDPRWEKTNRIRLPPTCPLLITGSSLTARLPSS